MRCFKSCFQVLGLATLLAGCAGSGFNETLNSQAGQLLVTDPQLPGGYYYDVWTFVPTKSDQAVFKMTSTTLTSEIILKDSQGNVLGVRVADGSDGQGGFNGDTELIKPVVAGQTYTVTTTDFIATETGAYEIWWPNWVQLTGAGN